MEQVEWKSKNIKLGNAIIFATVTAIVGALIGALVVVVPNAIRAAISGETHKELDWSELDEVYNKLNNTYNGEVDEEAVMEGAKAGLVSALGDKYTVYMNEEEGSEFYDDLHGKVGAGVGIEMGLRDGYVRVLRTLPDNPARKVGILAGDIIYKIDGEEVWQLTSEEIGKKMRGEAGTEVTVSVVRDGKELSFTMTREELNNVSEYITYDGNTAIITVLRFDTDTGTSIQKEAMGFAEKGINKIILDLRGNGGGYVSAAQDLLSLWLDGKVMYTQKSLRYGNVTTSTASGKAILSGIKTIVLTNGSTASASEIVTGALKDYGVATIVGEKTYGKGLLQSLYQLSDGAVLKVTTAAWYTPSEFSISDEGGIEPDIEVARSYEDINLMRDPQMDKAKEL